MDPMFAVAGAGGIGWLGKQGRKGRSVTSTPIRIHPRWRRTSTSRGRGRTDSRGRAEDVVDVVVNGAPAPSLAWLLHKNFMDSDPSFLSSKDVQGSGGSVHQLETPISLDTDINIPTIWSHAHAESVQRAQQSIFNMEAEADVKPLSKVIHR